MIAPWKIGYFIVPLFSLFSANASAQVFADSVYVAPHYRSFSFVKPQAAQVGCKLIFLLHGSGGSGRSLLEKSAKLQERVESEQLILVYPDAFGHYWNECRKHSTAPSNLENIDEQAFFREMMDYFARQFRADTQQVFAVGFSGGGHMAYKLAMTMPRSFIAISALVASLPDSSNMDCIEAQVPVSVLIINGTTDPVNPYEGGPIGSAGPVQFGLVRSTEDSFRYWARLAGYKRRPEFRKLPDADPEDGRRIEQYSYRRRGRPEVTLLKVVGGKHDYPGDIDVFVESWTFFKRQLAARQH